MTIVLCNTMPPTHTLTHSRGNTLDTNTLKRSTGNVNCCIYLCKSLVSGEVFKAMPRETKQNNQTEIFPQPNKGKPCEGRRVRNPLLHEFIRQVMRQMLKRKLYAKWRQHTDDTTPKRSEIILVSKILNKGAEGEAAGGGGRTRASAT